MSAQKLMKAACKKINFLNVYCNRLYTKKNIILPFSQPKKIVVKNVQYSIFRQFFTHFYFFSLYTTTAPPTLFFPFSFFVAVCLLLCFYSFFPYFYPCIFSKHFYTFYVSYVSYFFSAL